MAIVKTIDKHGHTRAGIDYILNPEKTMELGYVSTINCNVTYAHEQFDKVQRFWHYNMADKRSVSAGQKQNVTSIHIIQSFEGQEVSPEQAHLIAKELIRNQFGPHAQAVIATHNDTDNVHNHIIVNTVDFKGKRIHNNWEQIKALRNQSDTLCRKYGLSVIEPTNDKQKSMQYKEWKERSQGTSWKEDIRNDIDGAILANDNWDGFLRQLRELGYKVNNNPNRKYMTLQKGDYRPVRFATLGYHYSEERLKERIADPDKHKMLGLGRLSFGDGKQRDDLDNKAQDPLAVLAQKRVQYALMDNLLALQYILAIERIIRLIMRNSNRRIRKLDLSRPYGLLNDYFLARAIYRLTVIDKHRVKNKAELRRALEREKDNEPKAAMYHQKSNNYFEEDFTNEAIKGKPKKTAGASKI